jgi:hypothetical protein
VIDTATDTVSATITGVPGVADVALGPAGTLYAVAPEGGPFRLGVTYVIDTAGGKVTARIPRGGRWVAVDAGSAYLSYDFGPPDSVSVVTPTSATTMCPIFLGPYDIWFTRGRVRHIQLKASAIPSASFSATGLPAGVTLSRAGSLPGNPAARTGGLYQVMVTVANGISPPDTELVDIEVFQPPVITSGAHTTFRSGVSGVFDVTATGVPAPTFSETGPLPAGVTLSRAGVLEGFPGNDTGGRYPITLTASNGHGTPAKQAFTLTVNQRPTFTSPDRVTFRAGKRKRFTIVTRGFRPHGWPSRASCPAGSPSGPDVTAPPP